MSTDHDFTSFLRALHAQPDTVLAEVVETCNKILKQRYQQARQEQLEEGAVWLQKNQPVWAMVSQNLPRRVAHAWIVVPHKDGSVTHGVPICRSTIWRTGYDLMGLAEAEEVAVRENPHRINLRCLDCVVRMKQRRRKTQEAFHE